MATMRHTDVGLAVTPLSEDLPADGGFLLPSSLNFTVVDSIPSLCYDRDLFGGPLLDLSSRQGSLKGYFLG